MESDSVDLKALVGKTFERDGERCEIDFIEVDVVGIMWRSDSYSLAIDVPHSMLRLWLAGAVEVEEGK